MSTQVTATSLSMQIEHSGMKICSTGSGGLVETGGAGTIVGAVYAVRNQDMNGCRLPRLTGESVRIVAGYLQCSMP